MTDLLPLHDDIDLALEDLGAALGAAEVHGLLTGVACAGTTLPAAGLRKLLDDELEVALDEESFRQMRQMDKTLHSQLDDDELGFELLLPEDDRPLSERVYAMAHWCTGFLAGFGHATAGRKDKDFPEDVRDLLASISEFTRAETEDEDDESEREYAELVEFLRVAALTIFLELVEPRDGGPAPETPLH
jgi:yecA family protein